MKSKPTNYTDRNNKFKSLMVNVLRILRAIRLSILGSLLFLGSAQADHLSFSAKEKIIAKIHERTKTFYGNDVSVILPPQETIALPINPNAGKYTEYRQQLERLIDKTWTLSAIILNDDGILIDVYDSEYVDDQTRLIGFSMTKSITSMAVGRALCDGYIKSLSDKASQYDVRIANTLHGETSIINLLRMASGDKNRSKATDTDVPTRNLAYMGSLLSAYGNVSQRPPMGIVDWVKKMKPRSGNNSFHYSSVNTDVLGLVVQGATGMALGKYIERTIWADAQAEREGHLLLDINGDPMAHGFLYATRMDWARLALYVSKTLRSDGCFADYLRKATSKQINISGGGKQYGYQIWVNNPNLPKSTARFLGGHAQDIYIDKATGLIAVMHSAEKIHNQHKSLSRIFRKMNKGFPRTKPRSNAATGAENCPEGQKLNDRTGDCIKGKASSSKKTGERSSSRYYSKDLFGGNWSASSFHRSLNNKPYGYTVVPMADAPTGKFVHRFELRPGDCAGQPGWDDCQNGRERSELSVKGPERSRVGDDVWYQWWFKVDESWINPEAIPSSDLAKTATVFGQVHENDPNWCDGCPQKVVSWTILPYKDGLLIWNSFRKEYANLLTNDQLRNWHQITVHVKWSHGSDGILEAWADGKKKYEWHGQTTTTDKTYFKFGIYRGGKKEDRSSPYSKNVGKIGRLIDNHPGIRTSIVYYDQVTRSTTPLIGKTGSKKDSTEQTTDEPATSTKPIEEQEKTDQQTETTRTASSSKNLIWCTTSSSYNNKYVHQVKRYDCAGMSGKPFVIKSLAEAEHQRLKGTITASEAQAPPAKKPLAVPTTPEYLVLDVEAFLKVNPTLPELVVVMQKTLALKAAIAQDDQSQTKGRYDQLVETMAKIEGFTTFQKDRAQQRQAGTAILKQGKAVALELRQYLVDHMDAVNIEQLLTTLAALETALGQGDIATVQGLIETTSTLIDATAAPGN